VAIDKKDSISSLLNISMIAGISTGRFKVKQTDSGKSEDTK